MRSDPIYLFQELTWKASLGVLSVAGNVCKIILAEKFGVVKVGLEGMGDFSAICCGKYASMDDIIKEKKEIGKNEILY